MRTQELGGWLAFWCSFAFGINAAVFILNGVTCLVTGDPFARGGMIMHGVIASLLLVCLTPAPDAPPRRRRPF